MSHLTTCGDSPSAISSPESAGGLSLYDLLAGPTTDPCGLPAARASLSARQVREQGSLMSGICGPLATISSPSAALQASLENKLRDRLSTLGSTLYSLTWKPWDTGSGRSRFRLRGSALRTCETGPTGLLKTWPTPKASDARGSGGARPTKINEELPNAAAMAGWPAPRSADGAKNVRTEAAALSEIQRKGSPQDLCMAALIAGPARSTATGEMLTGSAAETSAGGRLNPELARWLMAFPPEWSNCAPTETPSVLKRRASLSKP